MNREPDGYLALASRRRWVLLAAFVIGAVAAGGISALRTPTYNASAHLLLIPDDPTNSLNSDSQRFLTADAEDRFVAAQVEIIKSAAVVDAAARAAGKTLTTAQLTSLMSVGSSAGSDVVDISVSNGDPADARALANALANAYIDNRRNYVQQALRTQIDALNKQLDSLQALASRNSVLLAGPNNPTERAGLEAARAAALSKYQTQFLRQQDLVLAEKLQTGGAQIVKPANLPSSPTSPKPLRDAVLGGVVALLLAWGVLILQARGRPTVSVETDFARDGLDLLCTVYDRQLATRGLASSLPSRDVRIAIARVVDRIQSAPRTEGPTVVAVEGVATAGGGSLLATNLAIACAESGSTTLLLTANPGSDLGAGSRPTVGSASGGNDAVITRADGNEILGTRVPNLYLGSTPDLRTTSATPGAGGESLSAVSAPVETVIVDVESLGRTEADFVLLVAEAGRTPEHLLRGAKGDSERNARVIGLVLLNTDTLTRMAS